MQRKIDMDLRLAVLNDDFITVEMTVRSASQEAADLALRDAASMGSTECRIVLMENGGNRQIELEGLLTHAAGNGDIEDMRKLLADGVDIHADDDSALRRAAWRCQKTAFDFLIEHGANPNRAFERAFIEELRKQDMEGVGDVSVTEMAEHVQSARAKTPVYKGPEPQ